MVIDITPIVNTCFTLIVFFIGLDFAWCGYLFLKMNQITHLPKFLGYWMFRLFERANKKNKSTNEIVTAVFSMKAAGIYMLLGGLQLIGSSMFMLLSQLNFGKM